jgi:hypothetical protein
MKRFSLFLVAFAVMLSLSLIGLPVVTEAAITGKKCVKGSGTVEPQDSKAVCKGGKYDGKKVKVKKPSKLNKNLNNNRTKGMDTHAVCGCFLRVHNAMKECPVMSRGRSFIRHTRTDSQRYLPRFFPPTTHPL